MNTYEVEIQETLARIVTVEAVSADEAVHKVTAAYKAGEIVLDSEDYIDTEFDPYLSIETTKLIKPFNKC